jgi:hypothetical protein
VGSQESRGTFKKLGIVQGRTLLKAPVFHSTVSTPIVRQIWEDKRVPMARLTSQKSRAFGSFPVITRSDHNQQRNPKSYKHLRNQIYTNRFNLLETVRTVSAKEPIGGMASLLSIRDIGGSAGTWLSSG